MSSDLPSGVVGVMRRSGVARAQARQEAEALFRDGKSLMRYSRQERRSRTAGVTSAARLTMKYGKYQVIAIVGLVAAGSSAHAQSSSAQAEALFRQGRELMAKGQLAEACAAFDASQKLEPTIATLLNQASCREKNGQLATAWGLFVDAERQTRAATDEAGRQMHRSAKNRVARLEPRLSTLTITVLPENRVGGLEILRDSELIDPGAWNRALPIDGGTYTITARAPGNAAWSSTVTIAAERDARTIETPKLKAAKLDSEMASQPGPAVARPAPAEHAVLGPGTTLYVDPASSTQQAAARLEGQARADALVLGSFPSATWFTKDTPAEVRAAVKKLVDAAAAENAVPTVVAYNLPHRDCSQYSAGGATSKAEYLAWIDAVAAGIGDRKVVVILEPHGLGIIPFHTELSGKEEWCKPPDANKATAAKERYEMLSYAVDRLGANPHASVYLDGTHSAWLGVGDIANRLVRAGVQRASGFFLNASNYEPNDKLLDYGTWISQCIHYGTRSGDSRGHFERCANQYYPANPNDYATWALSRKWYAENVGKAGDPLTHFVIDTSRNGRGPGTPKSGTNYKDAQIWCNPPDRGLGARPTTRTGNPLVDAYLWIKIPGESDGQCNRGMGGSIDPVRGSADPPAGAWFEKQAAELVQFASPPVARAAGAPTK